MPLEILKIVTVGKLFLVWTTRATVFIRFTLALVAALPGELCLSFFIYGANSKGHILPRPAEPFLTHQKP